MNGRDEDDGWVDIRSDSLAADLRRAERMPELTARVWGTSGFLERNLEALLDAKGIRQLYVCAHSALDVSAVSSMTHLEILNLRGASQAVDLSRLDRLRTLYIDYVAELVWPPASAPLNRLLCSGLKTKDKSLSELPAWPDLEFLNLIQGNLATLRGIARYGRIRDVGLTMLRKLEDVDELWSCPHLNSVEFDKCPQLTSIAGALRSRSVTSITVYECGSLTTVRGMDTMPFLRELRILGSVIEDGSENVIERIPEGEYEPKPLY